MASSLFYMVKLKLKCKSSRILDKMVFNLFVCVIGEERAHIYSAEKWKGI